MVMLVSGAEMSETLKTVIERWGFPTLVALAAGYTLRADVLLPLVEQHSQFLKTISESQREIADAVKEQTKLLYALQSSRGGEERHYKVSAPTVVEPQ
jgi:hypothetical protein